LPARPRVFWWGDAYLSTSARTPGDTATPLSGGWATLVNSSHIRARFFIVLTVVFASRAGLGTCPVRRAPVWAAHCNLLALRHRFSPPSISLIATCSSAMFSIPGYADVRAPTFQHADLLPYAKPTYPPTTRTLFHSLFPAHTAPRCVRCYRHLPRLLPRIFAHFPLRTRYNLLRLHTGRALHAHATNDA